MGQCGQIGEFTRGHGCAGNHEPGNVPLSGKEGEGRALSLAAADRRDPGYGEDLVVSERRVGAADQDRRAPACGRPGHGPEGVRLGGGQGDEEDIRVDRRHLGTDRVFRDLRGQAYVDRVALSLEEGGDLGHAPVEGNVVLPVAGRYYVVAYDPSGQDGKLWVATGREEVFGLDVISELPGVLPQVRAFHEVESGGGIPCFFFPLALIVELMLLGAMLREFV